jgi:deoxyribonuclease-1
MSKQYPIYYKLSDSQKKLFDIWDKNFPVTKTECNITMKKEEFQKNENVDTKSKCKDLGLWK